MFEPFVEEKESKGIVSTMFLSAALIIGGMVLSFVLYWAHQKSRDLFIIFVSALIILVALVNFIISWDQRKNMETLQFKVIMGSNAFMMVYGSLMVIIFLVRFIRRNSSSSAAMKYAALDPRLEI